MQQRNMFPNIGLYLQVQGMSNIREFYAGDKPAAVKRIAGGSSSSKRVLDFGLPLTVAGEDLLNFAGGRRFSTILADPPWQFKNRTGKIAPEHKRLARYGTMTLDDIKGLPVSDIAEDTSHLYLWVPNALLPDGIAVLQAWGFQYKSNLVWHKIRKDGGSDGRGVGFYFRNVTELILFGVRGKNARTLKPGRTQVNYLSSRKREHSRKPDEQYELIEACSPGPFIELFARGDRKKWVGWGNQADESYEPTWKTYANHSRSGVNIAAVGD
jgi:N6-adenosine-specific RNA methylase IME4